MNNIETIVRIFNNATGKRFRHSYPDNRDVITKALEVGTFSEITSYIRTNANSSVDDLVGFFNGFIDSKKANAIDAEVKSVETTPSNNANPNPGDLVTAMGLLGNVVSSMVSSLKMDEIKDTLLAQIKEDAKSYIINEFGPVTKKVTIEINDKKSELNGVLHKKFDTVLAFVKADEPIYLNGPAGTGKNVLCKQIAKALDLDFYFTNAVTQEYQLMGFTDAMGNYQETQFYKAFTKGGLFMLDEMDASIPEVLIKLNAAIANRYMDFPAPIGRVEAHENFRVIAAGNTSGNGADNTYVGRMQLDGASLNRFGFVTIDYDERIEEACANGDKDLLKFCRNFRKACNDSRISVVVSYRDISRMSKLSKCLDVVELLTSCLIKDLGLDSLNMIKSKLNGCGRYTEGLEELIKSMAN